LASRKNVAARRASFMASVAALTWRGSIWREFPSIRDDPDTALANRATFNLVWPQVVLANGTATNIELERIRYRLANFIVACASRGEFEPEKLRETALRAFLPKSSMTPGEMAEALPPAY
jgi:hypothetical protein